MRRISHLFLISSLLFLLGSPVSAQDEEPLDSTSPPPVPWQGTASLGISDGPPLALALGDPELGPETLEPVERLLLSFEPRFDAVDLTEPDALEQLEQLGQELWSAIGELLPARVARWQIKSGSDCALACSYANSGKTQAALAKSHADAAAASSDPDCATSDTTQAQLHASSAAFYAAQAQKRICQGPSGAGPALPLLALAESKANLAWTFAWYSYSAGCSESFQTAVYASNATVDLHNSEYYAQSCN